MIINWVRKLICAAFIALAFFCTSCTSTQKVIYFNNIKDTTITSANIGLEPVIQKNDILSITVSSLNPQASLIFNTPNISSANANTSSGATSQASGYLVNADGYIQFPILGNIKAEGLTKLQLKDTITNKLIEQKLLMDPIISIRYLNFRVTVLGEVAQPTVVSVPSEKINIFEAIGLAGDLTIYAKRDNVLLIREEEGKKVVRRLDLNSNTIFTSPYYYLKSNDIVYAEPNKEKIANNSQVRQLLPVILSALSFITIVVDRIIVR